VEPLQVRISDQSDKIQDGRQRSLELPVWLITSKPYKQSTPNFMRTCRLIQFGYFCADSLIHESWHIATVECVCLRQMRYLDSSRVVVYHTSVFVHCQGLQRVPLLHVDTMLMACLL
jgi:hypothetical protein